MVFLDDIQQGILRAVIINGVVIGITLYTDDTSEDVQCTVVEWCVGTRPLTEANENLKFD